MTLLHKALHPFQPDRISPSDDKFVFNFAALLTFRDLMLQRRNFLAHFAQFHMPGLSARFIEKVNDPARRARGEHDEKAHRTDQHRDRFWHAAEPVEHDLKDFLAQTNAGETDRQ